MATTTLETELPQEHVLKTAICLWKLDVDNTNDIKFQDQDKDVQVVYKQKAKKFLRLLGARKVALSDVS